MKRVLPFIILLACLSSCERQPVETPQDDTPKYDLFPLTVGNELYYSYRWNNKMGNLDSEYEVGSKRWKIISNSKLVPPDSSNLDNKSLSDGNLFGDLNYYTFQQISFNRTHVQSIPFSSDSIYEPDTDTVYFGLTENTATGEISFHVLWCCNIVVQRYSETQRSIVRNPHDSNILRYTFYECKFAADSGLIDVWYRSDFGYDNSYTQNLDSMNLIQ
jgi:hypothetical protein